MDIDFLATWSIRSFVIATMFFVGLRLTIEQIVGPAKQVSLIARSLLANLVLAPLLAWGLYQFVDLNQAVTVAFLLTAAAPGAPITAMLVNVARANLGFTVSIMFILLVVAVLTTPTTANYMLPGEQNISLDILRVIIIMLLFLLTPVLVGLAIHQTRPLIAAMLRRWFQIISTLSFVIASIVVIAANFDDLREIGVEEITVMSIFAVGTLLIGWLLGGPDIQTRRALALTTNLRNVALALLIAESSLSDVGAEAGIVAFSTILLVFSIPLSIYWGRVKPLSVPATGPV